ncbi:SMP-30/gluconolactonase/LRE family protein [Candidimonas sp. SYP-B2681]|uniref:SMP-30/gluconolactonase/LRE family protein n=1 Tax=Candidimonas sp. SYP-B2681 TaxID=2497686 RepID=UPI000F890A9E|nr:SMP-30/gluconolactonase/LRE family protein [Candidimonas sp. SYP-B2681]RTZ41650.1 SMP-30/gluconolactonase/LRE family protein [Candidimonas sp. SYP-B2681]
MQTISVMATGLQFPEGPVAMEDGSVLVSEIRAGRVTRVSPDGTLTTVADCKGGPNGLAIGPDGAAYVCNNGGNTYPPDHFAAIGPASDYAGGSIQRIDLQTGNVETLYTHCGEHRLSAPNDLVFDKHGGFYFSDFGKKHARLRDHGAIYYALPDGSSITEVAYQVAAANGVGLSPDGSVLYVAETETSRLWAFDIEAPGQIRRHGYPSPHGGRLVCGLPGYQRLDSMAIDAEGNVCIGTLITGLVTVISPDGKGVNTVQMPDTHVTNICFGGVDMKTAFITLSSSGQLVSMPWEKPGLRLNYNA